MASCPRSLDKTAFSLVTYSDPNCRRMSDSSLDVKASQTASSKVKIDLGRPGLNNGSKITTTTLTRPSLFSPCDDVRLVSLFNYL